MANDGKINSFTDLNAWQEGHKLVLAIYKITNKFPKEEIFGLTSQMRRAAVSVTSNIAEGFTRDTFSDKCHFYVISHASITELQNQLFIAKDVGYISETEFKVIMDLLNTTYRITAGLIRSTKEKR